jgi:hypothetical protein
VAVNPGISVASLAASPSGAIAYATSGVQSAQFIWFDRSYEDRGARATGPDGHGDVVALAGWAADCLHPVVGSNWDIWLMDMRGAMSRFTSDPALDFYPVWSPDGR